MHESEIQLREPAVSYITSAASDQRSLGATGREILDTLMHSAQWSTLAWTDIKLRYRRTTLGPLWITLGLGATVFSVGILYGVLFGNELSQYLPYFAAGLIVWTFIGSSLNDGCAVYLGAAAIIRSVPVAPAVHVCRMLARQLIVLAHNMLLILVLWLVLPWRVGWSTLLFVPGLTLNILAIFGAVLTLSILAARFRDVQLIVSTVLQLVFLLTPIIWEVNSLRGAMLTYVANANPIFHLIEVVRQPLRGEIPEPISWLHSGITAAVFLTVGCMFYARYRHRVPFWV
jgi:ABC-2 type transport system permease protein/lipopolysaccharide transport system permease protein